MKTREEMIRDVHARMHAYESEKKQKQSRIAMGAAVLSPLCIAAVIGAGFWKSGLFSPAYQPDPVSTAGMIAEVGSSALQSETADSKAETAFAPEQTVPAAADASAELQCRKAPADLPASDAEQQTAEEASAAQPEVQATGQANASAQPDRTETAVSNSAKIPVDTVSEAADRLGDAVLNGEYYLQFDDGKTYTADQYLGSGADFAGFYADCGISAEFYTVKESSGIVAVKLGNGGTVYLKKTAPDDPQQAAMGYCLKEGDEPPQNIRKWVSYYPSSAAASYAAPDNGTFFSTLPVQGALEEYSDTVTYNITIDLFRDHQQIWDRSVFEAEAKRLYALGYITVIEEMKDRNGNVTVQFSMHAQADQLKNFVPDPAYGYAFRMHDDAPPSAPDTVFNGFNN